MDLLPLGSDGGSFEGGQVGRQRLARRLERVDLRPPLLADLAARTGTAPPASCGVKLQVSYKCTAP